MECCLQFRPGGATYQREQSSCAFAMDMEEIGRRSLAHGLVAFTPGGRNNVRDPAVGDTPAARERVMFWDASLRAHGDRPV